MTTFAELAEVLNRKSKDTRKFKKEIQRAVCFRLPEFSVLLDIKARMNIPIIGRAIKIDNIGKSFI